MIDVHERSHREFGAECCKRLRKCIQRPFSSKPKCVRTWEDWTTDELVDKADECRAYSRMRFEARRQRARRGCDDETKCDTLPDPCCGLLDAIIRDAIDAMNHYCWVIPGQRLKGPETCPFDYEGRIIGEPGW